MVREMMVAGVLVSLVLSEILHLTPAGLITPAMLAVYLHSPLRIAYTVALALCTYGLLLLLDRVAIVYGRRQFGVAIVLSFALDALITLTGLLPWNASVIGVLTPGIMASSFRRQGVLPSLLVLAVALGLLLIVWVALGRTPLL